MENEKSERREFFKKTLMAGVGLSLTGISESSGADMSVKQNLSYDKVPRRTFGKTGVKIPIINVGGAQTFDHKYDKILHTAFREGVEYIDTALMYGDGDSHKSIAPFIKQVQRKNLWITSKVKGDSVKEYLSGYQTCISQLEVDSLDLFFMHAVDNENRLDKEFIKMGDAMKKQGKTRFFGLSCHDGNVPELLNKAAKVGGIDAIMFRYNFATYGDLKLNKAMDACVKAGIGLIAMKTQKSVPSDLKEVEKFKSKNFNLAQAKLKAVWEDERISSICSHMANVKQLRENISAAKSKVALSMNEFNQLRQIASLTSPYSCLGCNHICGEKLENHTDVSSILRYLMYYESYGEKDKARELFSKLDPNQRKIDGIDFTAATKACPQDIALKERLSLAHQLLA